MSKNHKQDDDTHAKADHFAAAVDLSPELEIGRVQDHACPWVVLVDSAGRTFKIKRATVAPRATTLGSIFDHSIN